MFEGRWEEPEFLLSPCIVIVLYTCGPRTYDRHSANRLKTLDRLSWGLSTIIIVDSLNPTELTGAVGDVGRSVLRVIQWAISFFINTTHCTLFRYTRGVFTRIVIWRVTRWIQIRLVDWYGRPMECQQSHKRLSWTMLEIQEEILSPARERYTGLELRGVPGGIP